MVNNWIPFCNGMETGESRPKGTVSRWAAPIQQVEGEYPNSKVQKPKKRNQKYEMVGDCWIPFPYRSTGQASNGIENRGGGLRLRLNPPLRKVSDDN